MGGRRPEAAPLSGMAAALQHRGPDAEGFWQGGAAAFGHRRLKVIDLEGGAQPMTGEDGRWTLVFNGEIYNFREIRDRLEKKGRRFRTRGSDTESLLALIEEKGMEGLAELEGMFAFSAYDAQKSVLYLAADRFGKKPLYYARRGGLFVFSSELGSLMRHPAIERTVDAASLAEYLAFEYIPAPKTMLKEVFKLEAGCYLEVTAAGIEKKRYGGHDFSPVEKSGAEWETLFASSLRRAVEKRLVADVPLGIFLSGGLDSASVLAMAREAQPSGTVKTFTIEFDDPSFDESSYAKEVARHFKTEYISEKCTAGMMLREHETILDRLDEPLADASFLPTFMLCRLARKHVTVALSGDGGDELLAGYPTFQAARLASLADLAPRALVRAAAAAAGRLPVSLDNLSLDFRLKQFFKGLDYEGLQRHQTWLGAFSAPEISRVLAPGLLHEPAAAAYEPLSVMDPAGSSSLRKLQEFYFRFYLQSDILVKADRASMAQSLEVRAPFLDGDLVKLVLGMPDALKLRGSTTKYILKKVMRPRLPRRVVDRPKKGFGVPVAKWICGELRGHFEETLSEKKLAHDGFFNPAEVRRLLREHLSGKADHRKKLWALYVFQKWKQRWMD